MAIALIGYTGFVGSNIAQSMSADDFYNSSNIDDIVAREYELIICAGVPAVKWMANKDPDRDAQQIASLLTPLSKVRCRRFVLISTIDVYQDPSQVVDEDAQMSPDNPQAYGRNRLAVESWVRDRFSNRLIARLPAVFGQGLKKNILFDLLHDKQTENIDPNATFQWYPVKRLWGDLQRSSAAGLDIVNLFPEPIQTKDILTRYFPDAKVAAGSNRPAAYRVGTKHAATFGQDGQYMMSAEAVFEDLGAFVDEEQGRG